MEKDISRRDALKIMGGLGGLALSGAGCLGGSSNQQQDYIQDIKRKPYNIFIFGLDTLRADHLGCYAYARNTSPNMDRFAKKCFQFENAFSSGAWTIPSFASLFTGQYPFVHRMFREDQVLPDSAVTIQEVLKEQKKYNSLFFVQNIYLAHQKMKGFSQGAESLSIFVNGRYNPDYFTQFIDFLKNIKKDKPHFFFFHTFDIHHPWTPPKPFDRDYVHDRYYRSEEIIPGRRINSKVIDADCLFVDRPKIRAMRRINDFGYFMAQYDGTVKYTDFYLGHVLDFLENQGYLEDSIIILVADHGESLGEHNFVGHRLFHEPIIKVPLLVYIPGTVPSKIVAPVQLEDIFPTLLDLVGIDFSRDSFGGISLLPLLTGEKRNLRDFVYPTGENWGAIRGEIDGEVWKLVLSGEGHIESFRLTKNYLFNLSEDPDELKNLFGRNNIIQELLTQTFFDWKLSLPAGFLPDEIELGQEEIENLRAFGYLR